MSIATACFTKRLGRLTQRLAEFTARLVVAASVLLGLSIRYSHAEPPTLTRLFPAGAQQGTTVDVTLSGKLGDGEVSFWCSHPGVQWEKGEQENQLRVSVAQEAVPGVAWMRIINPEGVSAVKPFIVGNVPEQVEQEPNDLLGEAMPIESLPLLVNGVLEKRGDVDQFRVSMQPDETLIASIQAERGLRSEVDTSLQVVDMAGNVLAQNLDYHGLDPQIVWKSEREQDVVVRVFGFPASPDSTIALAGSENYLYRLTVTTGPWCEGTLSLAISAKEPTVLTPVGWNLSNDLQQTIPPQATADGTFPFAMSAVPGVFALPVTELPIFVVGQATSGDAEVETIEIPAVVCGSIQSDNQLDTIEFTAEADSKWTIALESRQLGYPLDAVLAVTEATSGKQLAEVDDTNRQPDPQLNWTAATTGNYRVTVRDVNGVGLPNNLYRLWIRPQSPEYRVSLAETSFVGKPGEPLEIPVKIERLFGFDQPIEIGLAEAVEGIEAVAVISEGTGDTSKEVKLVLTASQPLVTSLRIVSRLRGSDEVEAAPPALPVADAATGIEDLWLTVR